MAGRKAAPSLGAATGAEAGLAEAAEAEAAVEAEAAEALPSNLSSRIFVRWVALSRCFPMEFSVSRAPWNLMAAMA